MWAADTRGGPHEVSAMRWIGYHDLVAKGVVNSRMTLKRLIDAQSFPRGVLITPMGGGRGRRVDRGAARRAEAVDAKYRPTGFSARGSVVDR